MINEEILSEIFRTRMLTEYREDWPNGRKGCLWFIHGRNGKNNVILLNTFWRKGYEWQEDDEMLPYEKKFACAQYNDENVIALSGFVAVIISYLFTQKEWLHSKQREDDIRELWNRASNIEQEYWHESIQDNYSFTHLIKGDEIDVVLQSIEDLLPANVKSSCPLSEIIGKLLNVTEDEYICRYTQELCVKDKLFSSCPILCLRFRKDLIQDEDVLEYYKGDDICGIDDVLRVEYSDENGGSLYCEYEKYEGEGYTHELARGIVASIVNYCAYEDMIERLNNQYITIGKNIDITNHLLYTPEDINFDDIGLKEVFDTYFQDIESRYDELHSNDTTYFEQKDRGVDMTSQIAEEEYESELQNDSINNVLYAYLREEQIEKLRKYRETYLAFLQRKFKKEEKNIIYLWPDYNENASDNEKSAFENELRKKCSLPKGQRKKQVKDCLEKAEKNNIINRPKDVKEEHKLLKEKFGYPTSYQAYNS